MKVWILNHYATTMYVGNGGRHYWLAKYLNKEKYDSVIMCASTVHNSNTNIKIKGKYQETEKNGIKFVLMKTPEYKGNAIKRLLNIITFYIRLLTCSKSYVIKNGKPDIIYASSVHPLTCLAGIKLAKRYNVKCICEIRDMWPYALIMDGSISKNGIVAKYLYYLEKLIYKKSDSLIFTMEGGADYIKDMKWQNEVNIKKIYNINNGVDLVEYIKNIDDNSFEDEDLLDDKKFKVIYTGAVRQSNGIKNIVEAAEKLHNSEYNDKIMFLIYGEGTEKKELEEYCLNKNLSNIKFKGNVNKMYIPYILSKSDLNLLNYDEGFCKALKYGGSQNKLFEYCASMKPILSNSKMNYNLIERYNCGKCADINNFDEFLNYLLEFYNMKTFRIDEYNKYCENAKTLSKDFDFQILTKKLEQVIENTMEE